MDTWLSWEIFRRLGGELPDRFTRQELKLAYRRLVKKHHPDRPTGSAEKFHSVQLAYEDLEAAFARRESASSLGEAA